MTIGMPLVLLPHFTEEIFSPSFSSTYAVMAVPFVVHLATTIMRPQCSDYKCILRAGRPEQHRVHGHSRNPYCRAYLQPSSGWGSRSAALAVSRNHDRLIFQVMRIRKLTGLDITKFKNILFETQPFHS